MDADAPNPSITLSKKEFWALWLTLFLIAYNISVISPVMPLLVRELNTSIGYIQSALVLFSLVTASFAPTSENLCRFYGRERIFLGGLLLYGLGIVAMALSPTIGFWVVSFSLLTGLAATPLVSAPWSIMDFAYDGKQEEQATVAFILASVIGGLSGSLLGGFIASHFGWRWSFTPSLIVFVLVLVMGRTLPSTSVPRKVPIDWVGGLVSFLGFGSILLGVGLAGEYGWWKPKQVFSIAGLVIPPFAVSIVPTLISVGVICLGFFAVWQRQQQQQPAGIPLMRVGLLRNAVFVNGLLTAMLHTLVTSGIQFNLYQSLPIILPLNPFQTAIAVLPYTLTMVVVVVLLLKRLKIDQQLFPKYLVHIGLSLLIVGLLAMYWAIAPDMTTLSILPALMLMGMGSGLFSVYIGRLTYATTSKREKPEGTGIYNPCQQLGSSLGRGILGTILITSASIDVVDQVAQLMGLSLSSEQRLNAITALQRMVQTFSKQERREALARVLPEPVMAQLPEVARLAAVEGMKIALLVAIAVSVVCLLLSTQLPKRGCRRP
ncbi:MFS transporter [Thermoleptolyngbya sp. M55_K2018_002]|uniref:MFS transporter n=1 Tax=Thermoleptolyngbya sp. M55_K2018_002 TaxID=2747808 RepID=UPI0019E7179F|nr:MFS transporter [Thermoleptolyngbya sp. M55_K2018_002]HIK40566.1 MFS transporter [Thermoleptolyngbya sp. M55_K2018_002]